LRSASNVRDQAQRPSPGAQQGRRGVKLEAVRNADDEVLVDDDVI
jgi:hypothetical protein